MWGATPNKLKLPAVCKAKLANWTNNEQQFGYVKCWQTRKNPSLRTYMKLNVHTNKRIIVSISSWDLWIDWDRVAHICVDKLTIIGSDNGLPPDRRQAIILTNARILLIGTLATNFSEILIEILAFSLKEIRLKVSSAKWRPFCLGNRSTTWSAFCLRLWHG